MIHFTLRFRDKTTAIILLVGFILFFIISLGLMFYVDKKNTDYMFNLNKCYALKVKDMEILNKLENRNIESHSIDFATFTNDSMECFIEANVSKIRDGSLFLSVLALVLAVSSLLSGILVMILYKVIFTCKRGHIDERPV